MVERRGQGRAQLFLRVQPQNVLPPLAVRQAHGNAPVKAAGAQQRRVQNLRTVGGSQHKQILVPRKAVHAGQKRDQHFVGPSPGPSRLRHRVQLVDKDHNRGGFRLLRLQKQIPHPVCAGAESPGQKIRGCQGDKGRAALAAARVHFPDTPGRLPGHSPGQKGLARSGRAHQQRALGKPRPGQSVGIAVGQHVHHLAQLFHRSLLALHIIKGFRYILLYFKLLAGASQAFLIGLQNGLIVVDQLLAVGLRHRPPDLRPARGLPLLPEETVFRCQTDGQGLVSPEIRELIRILLTGDAPVKMLRLAQIFSLQAAAGQKFRLPPADPEFQIPHQIGNGGTFQLQHRHPAVKSGIVV